MKAVMVMEMMISKGLNEHDALPYFNIIYVYKSVCNLYTFSLASSIETIHP